MASFYDLEVIFDSEFEPGRPFRFRLDQADYRDALHALEAATDAFVVPVSPRVFLVARDTPQKRNDLEQFVTATVQVPQVLTSQELIELAQTVRQVMGVEKLGWDNKTSSIVMRDRLSRVLPARALLHTLLSYRSEVMVELQLIEVRKSDALNYGVNLPNAFNIFFMGQGPTNTTTGRLPSNTPNPFPFNSRPSRSSPRLWARAAAT